MSGTFKDLKCWQKAFDLTISIYRATRAFPKEEIYGLTSQLRRAAVSVVSNIAEGKGRSSDRDLLQFLGIAKGSLFEVETHLLLAEHLAYLTAEQVAGLASQVGETGRLLNGLMKAFEHERKLPRGGLQASGFGRSSSASVIFVIRKQFLVHGQSCNRTPEA